MPGVKIFGGVDYTKGEAFPMALFDGSGAVVWSRPGTRPVRSPRPSPHAPIE
ncbi:MAG TPA: hypothetical protein VGR87_06715 [Candidatus Limnocylindria bacterium]|nr:hypothetical protein [Candidatus Limnocylindria bacterium]